jgi:transcriptional regulator with XRE-family HTH domain
MNATQCRMARAALGWTLDDLARCSSVNRRSILNFENGGTVQPASVEKMRAALVAAGAEFINGGKSVGVMVPRSD